MIPAALPPESWLEQAPLLARDAVTGLLPQSWRWLAGSLLEIAALLAGFGLLFAYLTLAERSGGAELVIRLPVSSIDQGASP